MRQSEEIQTQESQRKKEKRAAEKIKNKKQREQKLAGIKNSKYPLLKKKEALNEAEVEKIEEVKKIVPDLGKMYEEKEKLRDLMDRGDNRLFR